MKTRSFSESGQSASLLRRRIGMPGFGAAAAAPRQACGTPELNFPAAPTCFFPGWRRNFRKSFLDKGQKFPRSFSESGHFASLLRRRIGMPGFGAAAAAPRQACGTPELNFPAAPTCFFPGWRRNFRKSFLDKGQKFPRSFSESGHFASLMRRRYGMPGFGAAAAAPRQACGALELNFPAAPTCFFPGLRRTCKILHLFCHFFSAFFQLFTLFPARI